MVACVACDPSSSQNLSIRVGGNLICVDDLNNDASDMFLIERRSLNNMLRYYVLSVLVKILWLPVVDGYGRLTSPSKLQTYVVWGCVGLGLFGSGVVVV